MTSRSRPYRPSGTVLLKTMAHWDMWGGFILAAAIILALALVDVEVRWEWFATLTVFSMSLAVLAWNQWNSLSSKLRGSDYGELLRLTDESEISARLPYKVTFFVSLASAFSSVVSAIVIGTTADRPLEVALSGVSVFLLAWAALGVWSLALVSGRHDSLLARMDSIREEMAASQRARERNDDIVANPDEPRDESR